MDFHPKNNSERTILLFDKDEVIDNIYDIDTIEDLSNVISFIDNSNNNKEKSKIKSYK